MTAFGCKSARPPLFVDFFAMRSWKRSMVLYSGDSSDGCRMALSVQE